MNTETIAAIATGMGNAGIGVIRISGEEAVLVADRVFRSGEKNGKPLREETSHTIHYGCIMDGDRILDEVLILIMRAPRSYTREDVVEIDCHGGITVTRAILDLVIRNGARPAQPGEFTKRAFLNGRIDLSQAEAVMDLIEAENKYALQSSISQLKGSVCASVGRIRRALIEEAARIEAALDDPEHMSLEEDREGLRNDLIKSREEIERLLRTADQGRLLTQGIQTVIVGRPNAGKSSLLNTLLGEERAIVTEIAGTTRDALEETIQLDGILLRIIDTAGIRHTEDPVEKLGVEVARKYARQADLILYVLDASREFDEEDRALLDFISDRKALVLLSKTDLTMKITAEKVREYSRASVIPISIRNKSGLEELERAVKGMFFQGEISFNDEVYITNARHKAALSNALEALRRVEESMEQNMPEDFYTIDLMEAYEALGTILGESVDEDLADTIFSRFCMGK